MKVVFLGRLVPRKGCLELLRALALIKAELKAQKITITICGDGPQRTALEKFAQQQKLEEYVHFVGYVSEAQKISFLQQADIAVFPSTGGESFGIVLIEAMAAGSGVVLGGNNPGYASVLGPIPETLFDPKDTKVFADLLRHMINNPKESQRIHAQQQELVQQYDVAVIGKKLLHVYTSQQ